jgi:uroporphyrinogen-III synthase
LKAAATALARGEIDVTIFTTGVQLVHLWQIARDMNVEDDLRRGLVHGVVASIGPTTSEEVRRHGLPVDLEAAHPKFGSLVRELAERSAAILEAKRGGARHDPFRTPR